MSSDGCALGTCHVCGSPHLVIKVREGRVWIICQTCAERIDVSELIATAKEENH